MIVKPFALLLIVAQFDVQVGNVKRSITLSSAIFSQYREMMLGRVTDLNLFKPWKFGEATLFSLQKHELEFS